MGRLRDWIDSVRRRGRTRYSFAVAVVLALSLMPVGEALAFYIGTTSGSGNIGTVTAGAAPASTVSITAYQDPTCGGCVFSPQSITPGQTTTFKVQLACTANCPAAVTTLSLSGWSSDVTGCDATSMPGSFTMPQFAVNSSISSSTIEGPLTVTWVNLPSIDQTPCVGAHFTFTIVTP